jgi:hypothetical protein
MISKIIAGTALAGAAIAATAGAASAATVQPHAVPRVATGNVALASPLQFEKFLALQGFGPNKGFVDYTNFTYAEPGSGVWAPEAAAHALTITYQGVQYPHTLNAGLVLKADSNNKLEFSGTGQYNGGGYPWTITGQVKGNTVSFTLKTTPASSLPGYVMHATGTIAADGSASGTSLDSLSRVEPWAMPAKSFGEVLNYVAPVQSDTIKVGPRTVTLKYTIPASVPVLGGIKITDQARNHGPVLNINGTDYAVTGGQILVP